MPTRTTHTYAVMEVSRACHDEIRGQLERAGYGSALVHGAKGVTIELSGIVLRARQPEADPMTAAIALLRESRRHHAHCDDDWYCCALCDNADHGPGPLGGHGGESPREEGVCGCGAAEWNARVDAMLARLGVR
jgi:hypothetical protein